MPASRRHRLVLRRTTAPDEHSEIWRSLGSSDGEMHQLDAGRFGGRQGLLRFECGVALTTSVVERTVRVRGTIHAGWGGITLCLGHDNLMRWQGLVVPNRGFVWHRPGDAVDSVWLPGARAATLTWPTTTLRSRVEALAGGRAFEDVVPPHGGLVLCSPIVGGDGCTECLGELRALLQTMEQGRELADHATNGHHLCARLLDLAAEIVVAVSQAKPARGATPFARTPLASRRVARAEEAIHAAAVNGGPWLSVPEMCAIAGTNARTLREGFQQILGMAPCRYQQKIRLAVAHRMLRAGCFDTVAAAAAAAGFRHPPSFARHFRQQYENIPSAILRER